MEGERGKTEGGGEEEEESGWFIVCENRGNRESRCRRVSVGKEDERVGNDKHE